LAQFLEQIRQQKKEIVFVMFTGGARSGRSEGVELGADRCINKNGDPEAV
jgi:DNA-binding response OmpR family regulator